MSAYSYIEDLMTHYPALSVCRPSITAALEILIRTFKEGGKLLVAGNGGSAADADHICGELLKGFLKRRPYDKAPQAPDLPHCPEDFFDHVQQGFPAISLMNNPALVSAFSNDVDPHYVFAQQVGVYGRPPDCFLGLSTSGTSRNVVLAAVMARIKGMKSIALTGKTGGMIRDLADVTIQVPSTVTHRIQEFHLPIYHSLCAAVEEHFFKDTP